MPPDAISNACIVAGQTSGCKHLAIKTIQGMLLGVEICHQTLDSVTTEPGSSLVILELVNSDLGNFLIALVMSLDC